MNERQYTDEELIAALQGTAKMRNQALRWICKAPKWNLSARKVVSQYGAEHVDFEDVFSESLMSFTKNIMTGKFEGRSAVLSYFVSICKFKCLSKNRTLSLSDELSEHASHLEDNSQEEALMEEEQNKEKKKLMDLLLEKLKEPCRKVLSLYSLNYPMKEIALEMGYSNPQSAKNRTKKCREALRKLIVETPSIHNKVKSWI
jgi:RNA polymerase sigma factor (sigma-70 family)